VQRTAANQESALDFVHDAVECGPTASSDPINGKRNIGFNWRLRQLLQRLQALDSSAVGVY